jgi:uncharacterized membrane protein
VNHRRQDDVPNLDPETAVVLERAARVLTERRLADAARRVSRERPWQTMVGILPLVLIVGTLIWPDGTLTDRLRLIVQGMCDQRHNLETGGTSFPLDARCTGIYTGVLVTLAWLVIARRLATSTLPRRSVLVAMVGAIVCIGLDGINSWLTEVGGPAFYTPHNALRLASGLGAGVASMLIGIPVFNGVARAPTHVNQQDTTTVTETLAITAIAALVGAVLWIGPSWLVGPLALFSVFGAFTALSLMNLFLVVLASGLRHRVVLTAQLARPALLSMGLTVVELGVLASFRTASDMARIMERVGL